MPFKPLVLAATVASQRELFQAPLSQQAFLQPYEAAVVSPLVGTAAALPPAVLRTELAYSPGTEMVEIQEGAWSPAWFGLIAVAAVAGAAIHQAPKKNQRATVADQLLAGLAEHQLHAAASAQNKIAMLAMMDSTQQTEEFDGKAFAKTLPGITGDELWDPANYCSQQGVTEGKIRFYREVELKHGRLGMLSALGLIVGENYHPLFGGDIDVPSYLAFQQTPLQAFWPAVVFAIAIPEIYSVQTFEPPSSTSQRWTIRSDHVAGDLGFDPLGLKPEDPEELREVQTKELTFGRVAMLATATMIVEELVTGNKLF